MSLAEAWPVSAGQDSDSPGRLGTSVLFLVYLALWSVMGRYWGLQHDAQAYAVQALAKIQPGIFSGDLFLRFRSQDDFTLFPYVCARAIEWLGVSHAAALITFLTFVGWILVAWRLARALTGPRLAWLAAGLLLVIPGWYGADLVFRTAEPFLNARTPAEVACLGAILAFIRGRRFIAASLLAVATAFHPIMAFPAALVLASLSIQRREIRFFWPVAAIVVCVGAIAGAFVLGGNSALMSDNWLGMTRTRSGFLFLQDWGTASWQANAVSVLTVLLASQFLDRWPKRLATAAFWIAACGLALAVLASTVLPLQLLLQGQPWRWVWLSSVLSIMLLPGTVAAAWQHSIAGRAVALLLCASWLLAQWSSADQVPPIGVAGLLLVCSQAIWWARNKLDDSTIRMIMAGAAATLGLCLAGLAMSIAATLKGSFDMGTDPLWVQIAANVLNFVAPAACVVTAAWWVTVRSWAPVQGAFVGIAAATLAAAAAPGTAAAWRDETFSQSAHVAFSDWRERIPQDAEVLWADGLQETWFLLNRRSYLTVSQLGGIVFSNELAEEARRRAELLSPVAPVGHWFLARSAKQSGTPSLTVEQMTQICVKGGPDFVVDDQDIGRSVARIEWPTRAMSRYLYDCREFRVAALRDHP